MPNTTTTTSTTTTRHCQWLERNSHINLKNMFETPQLAGKWSTMSSGGATWQKRAPIALHNRRPKRSRGERCLSGEEWFICHEWASKTVPRWRLYHSRHQHHLFPLQHRRPYLGGNSRHYKTCVWPSATTSKSFTNLVKHLLISFSCPTNKSLFNLQNKMAPKQKNSGVVNLLKGVYQDEFLWYVFSLVLIELIFIFLVNFIGVSWRVMLFSSVVCSWPANFLTWTSRHLLLMFRYPQML